MAETSGFFQAMWDDSLKNPITEENTGWWDRDYLAKQFMDYFSLFIGNGVFISPTNQLKVIPGTGLTIMVSPGWAFINGGWYHNSENLSIELNSNGTNVSRIDSIRVRYSEANRKITSVYISGDTQLSRGDSQYDLELAQISVAPSAVTISASNITDIRPNENRCGFVKGLVDVISTDDLFSQLNAQFNEWFDTVKGQLQGDLATKLQLEFTQLEADVEDYKNTAQTLIENYVYNDYVIPEQTLTFVNKVCEITDTKVTANSLIDVYFTADTIQEAEDCKIYVDSSAGKITLTCETQPTNTIKAVLRVRVIE